MKWAIAVACLGFQLSGLLCWADDTVDTVDIGMLDKNAKLGTLQYNADDPQPYQLPTGPHRALQTYYKYTPSEPHSYQFTFEDMVWAAAALDGETGCKAGDMYSAAVLWTLVQRGALNAHWKPQAKTGGFRRQLQDYCQPIKPHWADREGACKDQDESKVCNDTVIDDRVDRIDLAHAIIRAGTWDEKSPRVKNYLSGRKRKMFSPECKRLAYQFVTGQLPNPVPGAADFSQYCEVGAEGGKLKFMGEFLSGDKVVTTKSRMHCPPGMGKGGAYKGDLFYSYQLRQKDGIYSTDNWNGTEVRIQGPDGGAYSAVDSRVQPPDLEPQTVSLKTDEKEDAKGESAD